MRVRTTAVWEQLRISQIFSGAALHVPLENLEPLAKLLCSVFLLPLQFHLYLSSATSREQLKIAQRPWWLHLAIPLLHCSVKNVTSCHRGSCSSILLPESESRYCESLIVDLFCTLDRCLAGQSHFACTVFEVPLRQTQYHIFISSLHITEFDLFIGETTVLIHASASTQPGPSTPIIPRSRLQLPCPSKMLVGNSANRSPGPLPELQPPM